MVFPRSLLVLPSLLAIGQVSEAAPTLRDALLCEAHKRVSGWYEGGEKDTDVIYAGKGDDIELRFMKGTLPCGGADSIVTFANFTMTGVKPIHVYSAIVNIVGQKAWNPAAHKIEKLLDNEDEGVRGVKLLYYAKPFSDRVVYEWETYNLTAGSSWLDATDLWFAATSGASNTLKDADKKPNEGTGGFFSSIIEGGKPVEAQSCLSAHHVRYAPDGKTVHASFTNTVNGKAPFNIPPSVISSMTWGKTVKFIKALKVQAKKLAAEDDSELWTPPAELGGTPAAPFDSSANCQDLADESSLKVTDLDEVTGAAGSLKEALSNFVSPRPYSALPLMATAVFFMAFVAGVAGMALRRGRRPLADEQSLLDEEIELLE